MKHVLTIGKNRILFKPTTGLNYRPNRGMVGRGPGDSDDEKEIDEHIVPYGLPGTSVIARTYDLPEEEIKNLFDLDDYIDEPENFEHVKGSYKDLFLDLYNKVHPDARKEPELNIINYRRLKNEISKHFKQTPTISEMEKATAQIKKLTERYGKIKPIEKGQIEKIKKLNKVEKKLQERINKVMYDVVHPKHFKMPSLSEEEEHEDICVRTAIKLFNEFIQNNEELIEIDVDITQISEYQTQIEIINSTDYKIDFLFPEIFKYNSRTKKYQYDNNEFGKIKNKLKVFSEACADKIKAQKYLDSIGIEEKIDSGKGLEFAICGLDNKTAKELFNLLHPFMQVSDFIILDLFEKIKHKIEKATGSASKMFCTDNIDLVNLIFNEMKDYSSGSMNYITSYNANMASQRIYLSKCKTELIKALANEDTEDIEYYFSILKDRNSFLKSFYANCPYIGFALTMNKFNPIVIPRSYNPNARGVVNTLRQIEKVRSNQDQLFIPFMENKEIIGVIKRTGTFGDSELMNKQMKKAMFSRNQRYKLLVTARLSYCICQYDYTNDDLVKDDFILGTYKTTSAGQDKKYNGVLIPIEKFKLKGI